MQGAKILLVGSDAALVDLVRENLAPRGYHLITAAQTELAYALEKVRPDLIIVDIAMPELQGIVHCLEIRRLTPAPIIMLTTYQTGENEMRGLDLKNDYCLSEPFDGAALVKQVEEAFNRSDRFRDCVSDYALAVPLDRAGLMTRMEETANYDHVCRDFSEDYYGTVSLDTSRLTARLEEIALGQSAARN